MSPKSINCDIFSRVVDKETALNRDFFLGSYLNMFLISQSKVGLTGYNLINVKRSLLRAFVTCRFESFYCMT